MNAADKTPEDLTDFVARYSPDLIQRAKDRDKPMSWVFEQLAKRARKAAFVHELHL